MKTLLPRILALIAVMACLQGCSSWFHPRWTPQEQNLLKFNVQGIALGSPPQHLKLFTQVKKDPTKQDYMDIYEIYNPNPHISTMVAWYLQNRLRKVELRYFNSSGVETLKISGGWDGIRDNLIGRYGPPSKFGPDVPVVATQAGLDPKTAKFNGVWIFSRIKRQVNYIAFADPSGAGAGFINVADTSTPTKKQMKQVKPFPQAQPPPGASTPGPGF